MKIINILSSRNIGDIFFDSIVLQSVKSIRKELNFNLLVPKKYLDISTSINELLESNINVISLDHQPKGRYID